MPDGSEAIRVVVDHPGAVVIVPIDAAGNVLLVRQPRYAASREALLELPAGTREPGETPHETAQRELREETGFAASEWKQLGGFFSAPGFCSEYLHLFMARNLGSAEASQDEDEFITIERTPLVRIPDLIRAGQIEDAKSIAGLLRVIYLE
ncbi:MAG: NUDIX hydrolase [Chloroflexi bacterium]|nr:NUDIX hydrolase [Chloroflexota bacterium]